MQLFQSMGNSEGLFMVRESTRTIGDFVLSLVFQGGIQHYKINVCLFFVFLC